MSFEKFEDRKLVRGLVILRLPDSSRGDRNCTGLVERISSVLQKGREKGDHRNGIFTILRGARSEEVGVRHHSFNVTLTLVVDNPSRVVSRRNPDGSQHPEVNFPRVVATGAGNVDGTFKARRSRGSAGLLGTLLEANGRHVSRGRKRDEEHLPAPAGKKVIGSLHELPDLDNRFNTHVETNQVRADAPGEAGTDDKSEVIE